MKAQTLARLLRTFDRPNDISCWTWRRAVDRDGYGRFWLNGGMRLAHRVVYELHRGAIPIGRVLDHTCRVTCCVNPAHLEPVTQGENVRCGDSGRRQAQKTHCPRRHRYTEANTYRHNGRRFCRACHNARSRRSQTTASISVAAGTTHPHTP